MAKVRVHELAKRFGLSNQELIAKLAACGIVVKSHSSNIEEEKALSVLQASANDSKSPQRRTVLRRRKEEPVETPIQTPVSVSASKLEPKLEPTQKLELETLEIKSELKVELKVAPKTDAVPAAEIAKTKEVVVAKNVVRVIDPNAIKARLAGENRSFRPRASVGGGGNRGPFQVREIRFGAGGQMPLGPGYGPGGPGGPGGGHHRPSGGPRSGKRKRGGAYNPNNNRREHNTGGFELWAQSNRRRRPGKKIGKSTPITQAAAHKRVVELNGPITVNDLAHQMSVKAGQLVTKLMGMGMMVTVNQPIDEDTVTIVANELGFEVKNVAFEETELLKDIEDTEENLQTRPPVVTVMGHVDHGKTSVLDAIRKTRVAAGEAGGITQHIGAYSVETSRGPITFLDTPGHEAFTEMRARGAQFTDIVILVVAADDGVMPQTIEAIHHAKAAKVPIIVAINKIDSPSSKPERVLQQLSQHEIVVEEWGGDVQSFKVSALKKIGLDELLEGIITQAETMELRANYEKSAIGSVIEAKLDKGRGPVATIVTESGTLKQGDCIVAGEYFGRVRAMYDSNGKRVKESTPSTAVQVLGLSGVPTAGDKFNAVQDDKAAKTVADHRGASIREKELLSFSRVTLENFLKSSPDDKRQTLRLIIKADVYGSVEALISSLKDLSTRQVTIEIVHSGVGTITESDINLAMASKAIIIGFNTKPGRKAQAYAAQEKVDLRSYNIIYEVIDEVKAAMAGLLAPITEETYLGKAEVRAVFPVHKLGEIAGCYVLDGKLVRSSRVKLKRADKVLQEGDITSLKRFKDDAKEVTSGYECGVGVERFKDVQAGDIIECFELKQVAAKLDESLKSLEKKAAKKTPKIALEDSQGAVV